MNNMGAVCNLCAADDDGCDYGFYHVRCALKLMGVRQKEVEESVRKEYESQIDKLQEQLDDMTYNHGVVSKGKQLLQDENTALQRQIKVLKELNVANAAFVLEMHNEPLTEASVAT